MTSPVAASIHTPTDEVWLLQVEPAGGWVPAYRDGLIALVVVLSGLIGLLVLVLMVKGQQQAWLVVELRVRRPGIMPLHFLWRLARWL